jgi:cyclopropane fatty-acyl-phospholipid synthase-like methyltransferase
LVAAIDPLVKLHGGDTARELLVDQAAVRSGRRVLDIGCGTGSLVVLI